MEFAERDFIASAFIETNDPYVTSGNEWHLNRIQALQAWDITAGSSNILIAVLDSGVDLAHPDLAGRILPGFDFVGNQANALDDYGHGTAVGGTIVASGNNGIGVAGVAYGCSVLAVKVMDSTGSAAHSTIAEGIEYAVQQGARIINLSLGGDCSSMTLQNAIDYAWSNNVLVVAAAGNNGGTVPQYPAACDHVLAVSATEPDDSRCWFSSYGSYVTLFAPGDNIWTTQRDLSNPYGAWSGTSFSSPVVAAVAALVLSLSPSLSNSQVVEVLKETADDLGAVGYDSVFAYGRVNAFRAVSAVGPTLSESPAPAPIQPVDPPPVVAGPETNAPLTSTGITNAPLNLKINGGGTVRPNLNGILLKVGRSYRVQAVANPGQLFADWSGDVAAGTSSLVFTMQTNLTIVANFVPNPFPAIRGNYVGLMANTNNVTPESVGYVALAVTGSGRFTGRLLSAGHRYGLAGQLNLAGDAMVSVRRGTNAPLALGVHVDLTNSTDQVIGAVSDGNWSSSLAANRNIFQRVINPAQQAGVRSFLLDRVDNGATTAAGLSRISVAGTANARGHLSDGAPFANSSTLSRTGDYPFYLSLKRGSEVVIGWLNFPAGQEPGPSGNILWVQTGTNAFTRTLQATPGQ